MTDRVTDHLPARMAVVWSVLRAELADKSAMRGHPLTVLDVGGGSGMFAVPIAELGHSVTVVDPSADALATLSRRAGEAGLGNTVRGLQGDVDELADLISPATVDLALCHGVLEIVEDPSLALGYVAETVRPGGCASVLAANRVAVVLARALGGHITEALRVITDPHGRWSERDAVARRFTSAEFSSLICDAGLGVEQIHGVGIVCDLVPGAMLDAAPETVQSLWELELLAAGLAPYRDLATQLHILARRS